MALFFDRPWFEARMAERGLSPAVLAAAMGLTEADLVLVFKDQRELSAAEVAVLAELIGATAAETADRAGVSTPTPGGDADVAARLARLEARVEALEAALRRRS